MTWLIENAGSLSVLLGIVAAGLIAFWWSNRQPKYLAAGVATLGVLIVMWLLILYVPSDRRQIEDNVQAMALAVEKGNVDEVFKHISKDFKYDDANHDKTKELMKTALQHVRIREVRIRKFETLELSREKKLAKVSFNATAWAAGYDEPRPARFEATFILEGDRWMLLNLETYHFVNSKEKFNVLHR